MRGVTLVRCGLDAAASQSYQATDDSHCYRIECDCNECLKLKPDDTDLRGVTKQSEERGDERLAERVDKVSDDIITVSSQ